MDLDQHERMLKQYHRTFKDGVERVQSHLQDLMDQVDDGDEVTADHLEDLHAQIASLKHINPRDPAPPPLPIPDPPQRLKNQGRPSSPGSLRVAAPPRSEDTAVDAVVPEQQADESPQAPETRRAKPGGKR